MLNELKRRYFSPLNRPLEGGGEAPVRTGIGPRHCVVPRARCRFFRIDLSQVPPRRRRDAAVLRVRRLSDREDNCHWVVPGREHWMIWAMSPDAASGRPVPESANDTRAAPGSARVYRRLEGFEVAVYGSRGEMIASRTTPAAPDDAAVARFARSAGLAGLAEIVRRDDDPSFDDWLPEGFLLEARRGPADRAWLPLLPPAAAGLFLAFQAGAWLRSDRVIDDLEATIAAREAALGPVLEWQSLALSEADRLAALVELRPGISTLGVVQALTAALPASDGLILENLSIRERDVQLVLRGGDASLPALVSALEDRAEFSEVTGEMADRNGRMRINLKVES